MAGLAPGDYYLKASNQSSANLIGEWYASPASTYDCNGAQPVTLTSEQVLNGIDFQLDEGATISGTVYQADGVTPLTGVEVDIWLFLDSGNFCNEWFEINELIDTSGGTYSFSGLAPGSYYIRTDIVDHVNLVNEWWANPFSTPYCTQSQAVARWFILNTRISQRLRYVLTLNQN